jgi:hypothetical protein
LVLEVLVGVRRQLVQVAQILFLALSLLLVGVLVALVQVLDFLAVPVVVVEAVVLK